VSGLHRKTRFWLGFLFVILIYALPIGGLVSIGQVSYVALALACFVFSIYFVYSITIKKKKLGYPIVNPEGHADVYTGRMPRPIYEDLQRYPWFFKKKCAKEIKKERCRKKR
jgi:hypothetical protein